jgi:hypothetical protein
MAHLLATARYEGISAAVNQRIAVWRGKREETGDDLWRRTGAFSGFLGAFAFAVAAVTATAFYAAILQDGKVADESGARVNEQSLWCRQVIHKSRQARTPCVETAKLTARRGVVEWRRSRFVFGAVDFFLFKPGQPRFMRLAIEHADQHSQEEHNDAKYRDRFH